MKKKILNFVFFASLGIVSAQDIHFSQFNFAPLMLNPAQAGVQSDVRALANYRNQWSSIGLGYKTMGTAFDIAVLKKPGAPAWMGVGASIYNDKAGDGNLSTLIANASLSAVIPSDKHTFSAGIQAGYNQKSVNAIDLQWDSQFDGYQFNPAMSNQEYFTNPSFNFFSLGGGVNWYYSKTEHYMTANDELKINMGISAYHFNGPKQSFKNLTGEKLYSKIVIYGNYSIGLHSTRLCFLPSYIVFIQGPSTQINVGNLFKYIITEASHFTHIKKACAISFGGFLRVGDAFVAQTVFEYDRYAIGFAYDMNMSKLKVASKSFGGFEVNFRFHTWKGGLSKSRV
jgi:type IX secretion system PorP/SprF family membrane protein